MGVVGLVDGELCHKQQRGWESSDCSHLLLVFHGIHALFHEEIIIPIKWNDLYLL